MENIDGPIKGFNSGNYVFVGIFPVTFHICQFCYDKTLG